MNSKKEGINYFFRMQEEFFYNEAIETEFPSGTEKHMYLYLLIRLYTMGLKDDGRITKSNGKPHSAKSLARMTGQEEEIVEEALELFKELELIDILDNGTIYVLGLEEWVGTEKKPDAIRKRKARMQERIEFENEAIKLGITYDEHLSQQEPTPVEPVTNTTTSDTYPNYKDLSEAEIQALRADTFEEMQSIVGDENDAKLLALYIVSLAKPTNLTGNGTKEFNPAIVDNLTKIQERLDQGYTVMELVALINHKSNDFLGDDKQKLFRHMKPKTLFGDNFITYAKEAGLPKQSKVLFRSNPEMFDIQPTEPTPAPEQAHDNVIHIASKTDGYDYGYEAPSKPVKRDSDGNVEMPSFEMDDYEKEVYQSLDKLLN